jgi:hypothetical protein
LMQTPISEKSRAAATIHRAFIRLILVAAPVQSGGSSPVH